MATVKDAIDMLNEVLHPQGFHCDKIETEYLPEEAAEDNTMADVAKQSYDGRWYGPEKDAYTLHMTADNMRYLWNAINVYEGLIFRMHLKPNLEKIIAGLQKEAKEDD